MTVHWDNERDLLDGEKPQYENPHKLKRNPTRCCGNSPGKTHKKYCHLSHKAIPELTVNSSTGKWFKPKSSIAMDTVELR